jgi:hypothetical protein
MDEVTKLLEEIKEDLLRKDETYRLVADCKPEPCKDHTGPCKVYHGVCFTAVLAEDDKHIQYRVDFE